MSPLKKPCVLAYSWSRQVAAFSADNAAGPWKLRRLVRERRLAVPELSRGECVGLQVQPGQEFGHAAGFQFRVPWTVLRQRNVERGVWETDLVNLPDAPLRILRFG